MSKKYGFGLIGCGIISKWHADSIAKIEDATIIGAVDTKKENAEKFANNYSCRVFSSIDEMLACDEIDIVCICTPSGLHAPMAVKVANAGKHFVVEKPMAITKQQMKDMIDACEKNGVKGAVISQNRFSDHIQTVKKAIENGELGDILLGDVYMKFFRSAEYYASAGWRGTWKMDGGGALMNQGIHGIDLLQYLVGPVKSVMGMCRTLVHDIEVEDTANVLVQFENGAIGTIQGATSIEPGYPIRIEISGTKGTVIIGCDEIIKWDVDGESLEVKNEGEEKTKNYQIPTAFSIDKHAMQIKDLIDAIKEDRRPLVDIYEGKRPVDIILGAYESSRTGKIVEIDK